MLSRNQTIWLIQIFRLICTFLANIKTGSTVLLIDDSKIYLRDSVNLKTIQQRLLPALKKQFIRLYT